MCLFSSLKYFKYENVDPFPESKFWIKTSFFTCAFVWHLVWIHVLTFENKKQRYPYGSWFVFWKIKTLFSLTHESWSWWNGWKKRDDKSREKSDWFERNERAREMRAALWRTSMSSVPPERAVGLYFFFFFLTGKPDFSFMTLSQECH